MTSKDATAKVALDAELGNSAYFAGDYIQAKITFTFPDDTADGEEQFLIEWATVQVHGHVSYDHKLLRPGDAEQEEGEDEDASREKDGSQTASEEEGSLFQVKDTELRRSSSGINMPSSTNVHSTGRKYTTMSGSMPDVSTFAGRFGWCIFASPPEVMMVAQPANAGKIITFVYRARLPDGIPPSYRGTSIRHWYVLTVGAKLDTNSRCHVLHVPLRILGSNARSSNEHEQQVSKTHISNEEHDFEVRSRTLEEMEELASKMNASAKKRFPKEIPLSIVDDDAMGTLDVSQHSSLPQNGQPFQVYRIGSETRHMAKLILYKRAMGPGERMLLSFDFSEAVVPCYQITVGVEIEEQPIQPPPLQAAFVPLTTAGSGLNGRSSYDDVMGGRSGRGPWRRIIESKHVLVADYESYNMLIQIPEDATPDFETELVSVKAYLRFEFVTARRASSFVSCEDGNLDSNSVPESDQARSKFQEKAPPKPPRPVLDEDTQVCPWRIPYRIIPPFRRNASDSDVSDDDSSHFLSDSTMNNNAPHQARTRRFHRRVWL